VITTIILILVHLAATIYLYIVAFNHKCSKVSGYAIASASVMLLLFLPHLIYNFIPHEVSSRIIEVEIYRTPTYKTLRYEDRIYSFMTALEVNRDMNARLIIKKNGFGQVFKSVELEESK